MTERLIATICALATCAITALMHYFFQYTTTLSLLSFSVFVIVPVGAYLIGAISTSGYCLATYLRNKVLDSYDYYIVIILSIFGIYLIYYFEYYFFIKNTKLPDNINVWNYIAYSIETSKFYIKIAKFSLFHNIGSSVILGYLFLLINLIGFILGSLSGPLLLKCADKCEICHQYLRTKKKIIFYFDNLSEFECYQDSITRFNVTPGSFKSILFTNNTGTFNKEPGSIKCVWKLKKCNRCETEILCSEASIYENKDWSVIKDSHQKIIMPAQSNIEKIWD